MSEMNDAAHERVQEAQIVLETLGMDAERSNERSALVLLALLSLTPSESWKEVANPMLGTRTIMDFIRDEYGKDYAPNTRETVRRFTLHQFVEAQLVVQNPDQPQRPVNSPKWNYQVTAEALDVLRTYDTGEWPSALDRYIAELPGLKARYAAAREMDRIPLTLPDGSVFTLTPGGQNVLLKAMVEDFCPCFTPGGQVLYIGDAGDKWALFERDTLSSLKVEVDQHGKMPDLVIYLSDRNWLVLLEAASSHGPVDSKRQTELADLFAGSTAGLVYVSCFPNRVEFRKYVDKIAWESEVWCADHPHPHDPLQRRTLPRRLPVASRSSRCPAVVQAVSLRVEMSVPMMITVPNSISSVGISPSQTTALGTASSSAHPHSVYAYLQPQPMQRNHRV